MKVVTEALPFIKIIPRLYPLIADTITLTFENGISIPFEWLVQGRLLIITLGDTTVFTQRENYSFTVKNGIATIYKGKMIFLKDNTDVQNYTNQSQDNKRWQ